MLATSVLVVGSAESSNSALTTVRTTKFVGSKYLEFLSPFHLPSFDFLLGPRSDSGLVDDKVLSQSTYLRRMPRVVPKDRSIATILQSNISGVVVEFACGGMTGVTTNEEVEESEDG